MCVCVFRVAGCVPSGTVVCVSVGPRSEQCDGSHAHVLTVYVHCVVHVCGFLNVRGQGRYGCAVCMCVHDG